MHNRNRLDLIRILGYLLLFAILWAIIWQAYSMITPEEAEASLAMVHGGLPDPMPAIEAHRNDEVIDLITRTLACEAPNEPVEGLVAVAWVIKTRAEEKGLTYEQVIKEPYQFSCWNSWIPENLERLRDAPEKVLSASHYATLRWIAQGVVRGALNNPLPGATHYYSKCLISAPFWAKSAQHLGTIGCHKFYRSE